jgi:LPS export ABC transporter protein LptC
MSTLKSIFLGLFVVVIFFEIFIGFPTVLESKPEVPPAEISAADGGAQQKMQGVHLVESQKGARDWELFADQAEGFEGQGSWDISNVKVLYYNQEKIEFTVTGDKGKLNTLSKDMEIEGNVLVVSNNGYRFQAPSVFYNSQTRKLKSPADIKMKGPSDTQGDGLMVTGNVMVADVATSEMQIERNVVGEKKLNNGKAFRIQSGSASFSGQSKKAKFSERVTIIVDTMRMEGPEAEFNYESEKDFLQSVLVSGGVRVSDLDKYATAERVQFDPIVDKFVFTGRPRVVQHNDEIMGDQIIFIDGGKKVKVENIKAKVERQ